MSKEELLYVALGDSLTEGFLSFFLDGFAYRFCRFLKCNCRCARCSNLGCLGITSTRLLRQLKYDSETRCAVKKADLLTISIGGNNLLKSASNNYRCINEKVAHIAIKHFLEDWPRVLYIIREELSSESEIYVMNLYNPYCPDDSNYEIADHFICQLNSIIEDRELIESYNYKVVDLYCRFKNNEDKDWTFFNNMFIRDPHPNWEGNQQIFLALVEEYCEND